MVWDRSLDWFQTDWRHIITTRNFQGFFNKQKINIIYINIYINSIVVLTVVLTPQSITTNTINSTLSSLSVFFFHPQQYNSHHFLSIFLIFKIIKTSFYLFIIIFHHLLQFGNIKSYYSYTSKLWTHFSTHREEIERLTIYH